MRYLIQTLATLSVGLVAVSVLVGQTNGKYNYAAQQKFIPKDLGRVYLGMPLNDLAKAIDLTHANVDGRFDYLSIDVPFEKRNILTLTVKVSGVSAEQKRSLLREITVKMGAGNDEYENTETRLNLEKIPASAFVYAFHIGFKKEFDQKDLVLNTYGKDGEVRRSDDKYHLYDVQWTKKTSDGLTWLIRSFHEDEGRSLQLLGRIPGTEWSIE
jgi:hypothetical protein